MDVSSKLLGQQCVMGNNFASCHLLMQCKLLGGTNSSRSNFFVNPEVIFLSCSLVDILTCMVWENICHNNKSIFETEFLVKLDIFTKNFYMIALDLSGNEYEIRFESMTKGYREQKEWNNVPLCK